MNANRTQVKLKAAIHCSTFLSKRIYTDLTGEREKEKEKKENTAAVIPSNAFFATDYTKEEGAHSLILHTR